METQLVTISPKSTDVRYRIRWVLAQLVMKFNNKRALAHIINFIIITTYVLLLRPHRDIGTELQIVKFVKGTVSEVFRLRSYVK